jgi:three-Cys-motif partner protein
MTPVLRRLEFDEIGVWSELKIEIIKSYAASYAKILAKQPRLRFSYIDGFSGPGEHRRKRTGERVLGSPMEVLAITPRFNEYHFVDLDGEKIRHLESQIGRRGDVYTYVGDSNLILPSKVFPRVRYRDYKRGLCLLDPYGLHLDWEVIRSAGAARSIEIFLNFPAADMQRNVFWHNYTGVDASDIERMDRYWGDHSWRQIAYETVRDLFGEKEQRAELKAVVSAFADRLKGAAGFQYVPDPLPMRNDQGAIVYFLFFASQNETGAKIASALFKKHRH